MENNTPLMKTHIKINIIDLMVEYDLEFHFENRTSKAIEAIFIFPIPIDSAFISMSAEIGGEQLVSQILPQRKAVKQYDDAINEGDSAIILERIEDGLLCVSLGNLASKEKGIIRLKLADHLAVFDRIARFSLPTVNRPRYGRSRLGYSEYISHDHLIKHPMSAEIQISGLLFDSVVECLSHPISYQKTENTLQLVLNYGMLNKDFIIEFKTEIDLPMQVRLIPEQEHYIGVMNLIAPPSKESQSNICLSLVMDCSGSMEGDAIIQSQEAIKAVLAQLNTEDYIQVFRFGDEVKSLLNRSMKATLSTIETLNELIKTIDANLEGTEIGFALDTALKQLQMVDHPNKVIVLVTDGAVKPKAIKKAQLMASSLNIRIFIVAVGSSASSDVLKPLADATNGTLERAIPCEPIHECVTRLFVRARELSPCNVTIDDLENNKLLLIDTFYPNDGATCMLQLSKHTEQLTVTINGEQSQIPCHIQAEHKSMLFALYGQRFYQRSPEKQKEDIALQYNLLTQHTSAVLIKEREKKFNELPRTIKIPQMHPHGMSMPSACCDRSQFISRQIMCDIPAFIRKRTDCDKNYNDQKREKIPLNNQQYEILISYAKEIGNDIDSDNIQNNNIFYLQSTYSFKYIYINRIEIQSGQRGKFNKPIYCTLALNHENKKELLGLWVSEHQDENEDIICCILTDLKRQGLDNISIAYINNLQFPKKMIKTIYPNVVIMNVTIKRHKLLLNNSPWNSDFDLEIQRTIEQYLEHIS